MPTFDLLLIKMNMFSDLVSLPFIKQKLIDDNFDVTIIQMNIS